MKLRIGISTCPNDTFAFSGLLDGAFGADGWAIELMDIQELNERLEAGTLEVVKASFHAALQHADRYLVLPVGAALGFGVGPLLLAPPGTGAPGPDSRVLCPGAATTATLLLRCFHPEARHIEHRRFDQIMPALAARNADFGVVIHEGRFTYGAYGLRCVEDLGTRWEAETGLPLPLGGILARRDLEHEALQEVTAAIRSSLQRAQTSPEVALPWMRRYAQELDDAVIQQHVDLYVNERTEELGPVGAQALRALQTLATRSGALPADAPALKIHGG